MKIVPTSKMESSISRRLRNIFTERGLINCFNPSFAFFDEYQFVVVRAKEVESNKRFSAYLARSSDFFHTAEWIDLSQNLGEHIRIPISDPKFVELYGKLFITFNTGYHPTKNQIYVREVFPQLSFPVECTFNRRMPEEKNWAFFELQNKVFVLYNLNPLVILEAKERIPSKPGTLWEFTVKHEDGEVKPKQNLSIGTQLYPVTPGIYYFIAHQKFRMFGKRLYVGRPAKLTCHRNGAFQVNFGHHLLVDSFKSLLGSARKHNPNLISCTYFSGIGQDAEKDSNIALSYGINDLDFRFVSTERSYFP